MSNYKYLTPQLLLKAICNAIREKTGSNNKIAHQDIPDLIDGISPENAYLSSILNIINGSTSNISNKDIVSVPEYRFLNNTQIEQVNLPECTSIGNNAFTGCINLTTVNLPKCTSIGAYAFGRYLLTGGRTDYTIEEYNACINLTTVNLPKCTSIGGNAFAGCDNLTNINIPECTSIGGFNNCTGLITINFPNCITIEGGAFNECINLTTVNLPECTYIDDTAFGSCINLTTVNLPKCTYIGWNAFWNCENLTTLILNNNQVTSLQNTSEFSRSKIANGAGGYVYVPNNLVNNYKASTDWSNYANQIKPISELPSNLKEEYGYD